GRVSQSDLPSRRYRTRAWITSWPSTKISAWIRSVSPGTRFTGNFPPSTCGLIRAITIREGGWVGTIQHPQTSKGYATQKNAKKLESFNLGLWKNSRVAPSPIGEMPPTEIENSLNQLTARKPAFRKEAIFSLSGNRR